MCGSHVHEMYGVPRAIVVCPLGRVGASVSAMALCLVAG